MESAHLHRSVMLADEPAQIQLFEARARRVNGELDQAVAGFELASRLAVDTAIQLEALHELAVGYFAAMTLGMVSRVSLGHSGRALEADRLTWFGFLAIIGVGATRALADFQPLGGAPRAVLLGISAVAWIAIVASWAARFIPIYLAPRSDGRQG